MQEVAFESDLTMTQDAFEEWVPEREACGDLNHYELLRGRVVVTPPAGYPHGEIEANVVASLHAFVRSKKLGTVFGSSQGYALPTGDTLEPDAAFISNERWRASPPPPVDKFLRVVPDLVVEVLSTSNAARDRCEKKSAYAESGVTEYWIIDRRRREVLVFELEGNAYADPRVWKEPDAVLSSVLPGFEVLVADVLPEERG